MTHHCNVPNLLPEIETIYGGYQVLLLKIYHSAALANFRALQGFLYGAYMEASRILNHPPAYLEIKSDRNSGPGGIGGITVVSSKKRKASTTLPGKVEKVIRPHPSSGEPEKAQIGVEGADHLYREIRVPNSLVDSEGHKVKLEEGAEVEVKIESDAVSSNGAHTQHSPARPRA